MNNDLVIGILSASVALAGLLLVFLSFIFSAYQSFPADTQSDVLRPYQITAWSAIVVFTLCIIDAILSLTCVLWRLSYWAATSVFFITIIGVLEVATVTFVMIIRR
jgi:hypothetical protein